MATINISLPDKLRGQANELIKKGYYSSFSDLTRTAIRKLTSQNRLDFFLEEAKKDIAKGKAIILNTQEDIDKFVDSL